MVVLLWILQKISPIYMFVGLLYLLLSTDSWEGWMFVVGGIAAVIGGIFGATSWAEDVPPRWYWSKSNLELFDNKVGAIFGWAWSFFLLAFCVYAVIDMVG